MDNKGKGKGFKMPHNFSLTPIKPSEIPADDVLIKDAQTTLDASVSWQSGNLSPKDGWKTSKYQEFDSAQKSMRTWHCVVKEVQMADVSFGSLWAKMGKDKAENQPSYVATISRVTRISKLSDNQSIWTILFTYPPPMSPRVFTVLQASWLFQYSHRRRGIVVTLPVDLSEEGNLAELEERGVKGLWASIEHLQELEGDVIEWRRVACLDTRGLVPKFWAERKLEDRMIKEMVSCIDWLKSQKEEEKSAEGLQEETKNDAQGIIQSQIE